MHGIFRCWGQSCWLPSTWCCKQMSVLQLCSSPPWLTSCPWPVHQLLICCPAKQDNCCEAIHANSIRASYYVCSVVYVHLHGSNGALCTLLLVGRSSLLCFPLNARDTLHKCSTNCIYIVQIDHKGATSTYRFASSSLIFLGISST